MCLFPFHKRGKKGANCADTLKSDVQKYLQERVKAQRSTKEVKRDKQTPNESFPHILTDPIASVLVKYSHSVGTKFQFAIFF